MMPSVTGWSSMSGVDPYARAAEARYRINEVPVTIRQARTACNLAKGVYESCVADMSAHGFRKTEESQPVLPTEQAGTD